MVSDTALAQSDLAALGTCVLVKMLVRWASSREGRAGEGGVEVQVPELNCHFIQEDLLTSRVSNIHIVNRFTIVAIGRAARVFNLFLQSDCFIIFIMTGLRIWKT